MGSFQRCLTLWVLGVPTVAGNSVQKLALWQEPGFKSNGEGQAQW